MNKQEEKESDNETEPNFNVTTTTVNTTQPQQPPVLQQQQSINNNNPNYVAIPPVSSSTTQAQQQAQQQQQQDQQQEQLSPLPLTSHNQIFGQQLNTNQVHPVIEQQIINESAVKSEILPQPQQFSHPTHSNVYNNVDDLIINTTNNDISKQESLPLFLSQGSVVAAPTTAISTAAALTHYENQIPKSSQQNDELLNNSLISTLDNQLTSVFNKKRSESNEMPPPPLTPQLSITPIFPQQQVTGQNLIPTTPSQQQLKPIIAPSNTSTIASTMTTNSVTASIPSNPIGILPTTTASETVVGVVGQHVVGVGLSRRNSKELLSLSSSMNGKQNLANQLTYEVESHLKRAFDNDQYDTGDSNSMKSLQSKNDSVIIFSI